MHTISIKSEELIKKESQLKSMASRIENTKDCLSRISNSLDSDIKYRHNIDCELNRLYKDLDNIGLQVYKTGNFLKETGRVYHETEIKLDIEFNKLSLEINDNYYTNDPNIPLPIMKKEESFFERLGNKLKSGIKHLVDFFTNSNEKVNNESLPYYNDNNSNFVIVNDYLQPDPYMYYTYDTKTYLESRGDWPTWDDIDNSNSKTNKGVLDYLERSGEQIIKGNYTDEVTLLGTGGQIGLGILGLDVPMDIRDIVCDFHKWEWSWGHVGQTALDLVGLIPVVGALKYSDEIGTLFKGVNKSSDIIKNIDKTDEIVNGIKASNKSNDVLESAGEGIRKRAGKKVKPIEKTFDMAINPDIYIDSVVKKYRINLKGSGKNIEIIFNPDLKCAGKSRQLTPNIIEIGPSALISEDELANTIAHELNHARSWLKGGIAPETTAYRSGDALSEYINGGR